MGECSEYHNKKQGFAILSKCLHRYSTECFNIHMPKTRIENFTDAVLAIVMTILVLNLQIPNIHSGASITEYSITLLPIVPKLISFIVSFLMVAVYWVNHHSFFQYIAKGTVGLIWVNTLLLLSLCLLPFPTALLGSHPTDQFPIILYAANLLICGLAFFALRDYAGRHHLLKADCNQKVLLSPKQSLPGIILSIVSIIFCFVNVYLSLLCFIIFPIIYLFPKVD